MSFKFFAFFILSICFFNVHAQKVDGDSLVKSMKSAVTTFFVKKGILDKDKVKNDPDFVFGTELVEEKQLGFNINGIYQIGVLQSHSERHILIKEKDQFKIFDIKQIAATLRAVIDYSTKNEVPTDKMLSYMRTIMEMYDWNYKTIPNGGGLMIQKQ